MYPMNDKNLDNLLKQWASRRTPDEVQLRQLSERILDEINSDRPAPTDRPASTKQYVDRSPWRVSAALRRGTVIAVAASLLIGGFAVLSYMTSKPTQQVTALEIASISGAELHEHATLFHEVERMFADDLRWVASTNTGMQMGIQPVSVGLHANASPMLIRTVVLQRRNTQSPWREILKTDVLTRNEEMVELAQKQDSPNRLMLWAYTLPDAKVVVESKIVVDGHMAIDTSISKVLTPGKPVQVFRLKTKDGECRVFQAVMPLSADKEMPCIAI